MFKIVNMRDVDPRKFGPKEDGGVWYVGRTVYPRRRGGNIWPGSPLANPCTMRENTPEERQRVIQAYREWLPMAYKESQNIRDEIDCMVDVVMAGKPLTLGCWCYPLPCHASVIIEMVQAMVHLLKTT